MARSRVQSIRSNVSGARPASQEPGLSLLWKALGARAVMVAAMLAEAFKVRRDVNFFGLFRRCVHAKRNLRLSVLDARLILATLFIDAVRQGRFGSPPKFGVCQILRVADFAKIGRPVVGTVTIDVVKHGRWPLAVFEEPHDVGYKRQFPVEIHHKSSVASLSYRLGSYATEKLSRLWVVPELIKNAFTRSGVRLDGRVGHMVTLSFNYAE